MQKLFILFCCLISASLAANNLADVLFFTVTDSYGNNVTLLGNNNWLRLLTTDNEIGYYAGKTKALTIKRPTDSASAGLYQILHQSNNYNLTIVTSNGDDSMPFRPDCGTNTGPNCYPTGTRNVTVYLGVYLYHVGRTFETNFACGIAQGPQNAPLFCEMDNFNFFYKRSTIYSGNWANPTAMTYSSTSSGVKLATSVLTATLALCLVLF